MSFINFKLFFLISALWVGISGCTNENTGNIQSLTVMTYNIHHANPPTAGDSIDIDAIVQVIQAEDPDLVALQEVDVFTRRSGTDLHQAREIAAKLNMYYYFAKALDYQNGLYGNAVLSKFTILDSLRIGLPPMEGVQAEYRNWAGIKVEVNGNELWFGSTHLDFGQGENNMYQSTTLLQQLDSFVEPVIIGGDFNRREDSETIALFDTQFQRTCSDCPPTIPVVNPNRTIDHIMFRPKDAFTVIEHRVVDEQYASDHLPVVAKLLIK